MSRQNLRPATLAVAIALAWGACAVHAQGTASPDAPLRIVIEAQTLAEALNDWARQTRTQIIVRQDLVAGKTAPAVSGSLTPGQALDRLLAGSGLSAVRDGNAVVIRAASPAETATLPAVMVSASPQTELPTGPVDGYVARRSATATKTDTPIAETPQSIAVITREELDARQAQTVRAALRFAPGVTISDDADNRLDSLSSRGFALDQYLDGLKALAGTWSVVKIEPYMLERVEVLKGPSSVLYGQASPGGVLNMVSKRASLETTREVQLQYGSHDFKEAAFDFGGAVDADRGLSARLVGLVRDTHTEVDHTREKRIDIAPSLTWQPDARTRITLLADYLHDPAGGIWTLLPAYGTLLPNRNGRIDRSFFTGTPGFENFDRTQSSIGYAAEHRFAEGLTLRQNLRYRRLDTDYKAVQGTGLQADLRTLNRSAYTSDEKLRTLTVDTQMEMRFATGTVRHKLLTGLDYQHANWDNFTRWGGAPTLDILAPDYQQAIALPPVFQDAFQRSGQIGVYAQDEIRWDRWRLQLGGRKDWARTDTDNHLAGSTTRQRDNRFTGRAGALYVLDNGLAPYLSYSTSFSPQAGTGFDGRPFAPTKGKQTEMGVKYQPPGSDMLLTAAVFDLRQTNVTTTDLAHPNFQEQTGEVESRGVELSAVANLSSRLKLRASYSYLDNSIARSNTAGTVGKRQADIPMNQASLWVDYLFGGDSLPGLAISGGVRAVGKSYTTALNDQAMPGYTLFDAALRYDFGRLAPGMRGLTLALNAANLFDKTYISYCTAIGCRYGLGRTVVATLRYAW
ncbi:MAG: TonB-dependent siderophore receptor [Burkholderiaceae bacterium]